MTPFIDIALDEKVYVKGKSRLSILNNFRLTVRKGEKVAIIGESGVGKSSLLNILGLIDTDYTGSHSLMGVPTRSLTSSQMAQWRNENIGFVLQESALIDTLTLEDNIALPLLYADSQTARKREGAISSIAREIGISEILHKKPLECSGGQRARAVFARAIIMNPPLILADEPTASLDPENKEILTRLLFDMNRRYDTTLMTVTHDMEEAQRYDRIVRLTGSREKKTGR